MQTLQRLKIEIPDTSHFFNTQEFNRLAKISFYTKINEAVKSLASKSRLDNALDLGDKNE